MLDNAEIYYGDWDGEAHQIARQLLKIFLYMQACLLAHSGWKGKHLTSTGDLVRSLSFFFLQTNELHLHHAVIPISSFLVAKHTTQES